MKINAKVLLIAGFLILIIVAAAIAGFAFLNNNKKQPQKYTDSIEKVNLGVATNFMCSLMWVAQNKGYFKENGLDVNMKKFSSGKLALDAMLKDGSQDIVTVAQTPIVLDSFADGNFSIIAGTSYSYDDVFVLARKDQGIASPADLKGKKIGVTYGTIGQYFLDVFLDANNIHFSDVKTVNLPADQLAQSISDGTVDAISTWQPYIYNAKNTLGANGIIFPNNKIFREDIYSVASKQFIQNHPKALVKFLKAIKQAEDFVSQNKNQAADIMTRESNMDKDFIFSSWDNYKFGLFLDQDIFLTLESQARWAIENKLTDKTKVPNYFSLIYTDALLAVKPEAVTIIR